LALNKSQTSLGVKIVLVIVAIAMIGFLFPAVFSLFNSSNTSSGATQNTAKGTLDTIAAKYTAQVAANDQTLQSNPANYAVLVSQGNLYFDWALEVMQAAQQNTELGGNDQPLWLSARQYYERAAEATKAIDAPVQTDLSIAYFYSGETTQAVGTVNKVLAQNPKFAPAWLNLGVFYSAQGDKAKAIAAYEKVLELDPKGTTTNTDYAKQEIAALKGTTTTTSTTSP